MNKRDAISPTMAAMLARALRPQLFVDSDVGLNTYAVLDGATISTLLDHLYEDPRPEFVCLYRGDLEPDMAEVAPYLVRLEPEGLFTDWLLTEGWGKHWGIFALSPANLVAVRKHFRTFLMVKSPEGKQVYFRYYDPRVLRTFLPTCNPEETAAVFGPINRYLCEDENMARLLTFAIGGSILKGEVTKLDQA